MIEHSRFHVAQTIKEIREVKQGQALKLMHLTHDERDHIREKISRQSTLRVFMHPFCDLHNIRSKQSKGKPSIEISLENIMEHALGEKELTDKQKNLLHETIKARRKHNQNFQDLRFSQDALTPSFISYFKTFSRIMRANPPVIILAEEEGNENTTIRALRNMHFQGDILYYRTKRLDPKPSDEDGNSLSEIAWAIHKLGIQELLIGGQYIDFFPHAAIISPRKFTGNPYVYRMTKGRTTISYKMLQDIVDVGYCVGYFAEKMRMSGFFPQITISKASFPFSIPQVLYMSQ